MGEAKHVLMLSFPSQGHVSSFLNLARRLVSTGVKVTMASTMPYHEKFVALHDQNPLLRFAALPDATKGGGGQATLFPLILSDQTELRDAAAAIVADLIRSDSAPSCILADRFFHWAPDLADSFQIPCACVFTPCLSAAICDAHHHRLDAEMKKNGESGAYHVDGLPPLQFWDLPGHMEYKRFGGYDINKYRVPQVLAKAKWVLVNTVEEIEGELVNYLPKAIPIGPLVSNKVLGLPDQDELPSLHKPDLSCIEWLNQQAPSSVLYISFGSIAAISAQQIEEIALGLEDSKQPFLWVIRSGMVQGLKDGFMEDFETRNKGKGLIISWAPQLDVLKNSAIAGFMTHCGWNSIIESLCCGGIPLLGLPLMAEQCLNCKMLQDVWKIGVRLSRDERGIVSRKIIANGISRLINNGEDLKKKTQIFSDALRKAVMPQGSSFRNLETFVSSL